MIHFFTTLVFLLSFNTTSPTFSSEQYNDSVHETEELPLSTEESNIINDDIMGV